ELFKKNKELFANGLEELRRTELVKHVIKTQDAKPIKQPSYWLAQTNKSLYEKNWKN
ncbi:12640_t:CDS:1, partial [Cetraspora pellucida]